MNFLTETTIFQIFIFLLIALVNICALDWTITDKLLEEQVKQLDGMKLHWNVYLNESRQVNNRTQVMKNAVSNALGLYHLPPAQYIVNKDIVANTVWIHMIEADPQNDRFRKLLRNTLCHEARFNIKSLVYLLDNNFTSFNLEKAQLQAINPHTQVISYPFELFWSLIVAKSQPFKKGWGRADYNASSPVFSSFGSMVMLVPVLEVLEMGHNVIYSDVDIGFTHLDPIPHLLNGMSSSDEVDFSVSQESRNCNFNSYNPHKNHLTIEPNTGLMAIKSTHKSIQFFRKWLEEIVNENIMNDQRVMNYEKFTGKAMNVHSCNNPLTQHSTHSKTQNMRLNPLINPTNNKPYTRLQLTNQQKSKPFKWCLLNEFMFQNGKTAFHCANPSVKKDGASFTTYVLGMHKFAASVEWNSNASNDSVAGASSSSTHNSSSSSVNTPHLRGSHNITTTATTIKHHIEHHSSSSRVVFFPISVHANYVDDKVGALDRHGVWLYNETAAADMIIKAVNKNNNNRNNKIDLQHPVCTSFNLSNTPFSRLDWSVETRSARRDFAATLNSTGVEEGGVVRFQYSGEGDDRHYVYKNHHLHLIPDALTLQILVEDRARQAFMRINSSVTTTSTGGDGRNNNTSFNSTALVHYLSSPSLLQYYTLKLTHPVHILISYGEQVKHLTRPIVWPKRNT